MLGCFCVAGYDVRGFVCVACYDVRAFFAWRVVMLGFCLRGVL